MDTFVATDGYDRRKTKNEAAYRYMTIAEAKALRSGERIDFQGRDGQVRQVKVNGSPKTWKRDASRVEVPVKYGMYECTRLESTSDGRVGNGIAYLVVKLKSK